MAAAFFSIVRLSFRFFLLDPTFSGAKERRCTSANGPRKWRRLASESTDNNPDIKLERNRGVPQSFQQMRDVQQSSSATELPEERESHYYVYQFTIVSGRCFVLHFITNDILASIKVRISMHGHVMLLPYGHV